jgi:hypothetical protein
MKKQKSIEEIKADYHLFIDVQMGKYLGQNNKDEFDSNAEAKDIIGKILTTWNNKIASEKEKLDTLDVAAKTGWFNSIEIQFLQDKTEKQSSGKPGNIEPSTGVMNKIFPGLSDRELDLIPFCWALLEPLGYKYERMREIIAGSVPAEIEIQLLRWSHEIVSIVNKAVHAKSESKTEELMDIAYYRACERLENKDAKEIIIKLQKYVLKEIKKKKNR